MRGVTMIAGLGLMAIGAAPMPPIPGTVTVALVDDGEGDDQPFADAVGQALGNQDFTLLSDHGRYVAEVTVAREVKGLAKTRVARDPAVAGMGSWGPSVTVPLGSRKTVLRDLVATTLTVRLMTRADRRPVWAGSAMTANVDGAPVAAKLVRAAFAPYPQTLGYAVSVP